MSLKDRLQRLSDNWIEIEKHDSGSFIVIDTLYPNASQPGFKTYKEAVEYGESLIQNVILAEAM